MFKFISLLFLLLSVEVSSQIIFDKTEHNFGEINQGDQRYVDIYLKNTGKKNEFILSVRQPLEVVFIQKGAMITPDSSTVIRFQINQRKKGKFNYKIPVYTSDKQEPTIITLKGEMSESPEITNNFTACPNFGQSPAQGNPLDFQLIVETVDKETGEKLQQSTVAIIQNGNPVGKYKTGSGGRFTTQIPLGITYFYAVHDNYFPAELGTYVNFKRNLVVLELERKPETPKEEKQEDLVTETIKPDEPIADSIEIADIIETTTEEKNENLPPELSELDENNFDPEYFKPVNVVFVIDVSSSMRQEDRIELLKYSLNQLVEMLRPQDRIGLVSYATNTKVLLHPTSGANKEEINEIVKDLKASGLTAGGAGIKLGYKQARKNFIKDGNNQVIIITDGAFNRNSGDYKKNIEKYLKKGIKLSVVGIKSNERAEENMQEAAQLGEGRFIRIDRLADAQRELKQEIRLASFRK
ncbi:MAG: VWA domain-containing protein [Brumimicrobium sp.]|nr:VWA domain-containing protein [Brumimicrobium sp.]